MVSDARCSRFNTPTQELLLQAGKNGVRGRFGLQLRNANPLAVDNDDQLALLPTKAGTDTGINWGH